MRVLMPLIVTLMLALPASAQDVLPAPLYWLEHQGQVWRLDRDGLTIHPITSEAQPITDFDISSADGRLVILYENDLFLTDADGQNRVLLVDGPQLPPDGGEEPLTTLATPRWSPDGTRIAYAMGGVNVLDLASGESTLLAADNIMNEGDLFTRNLHTILLYPYSWSPSGERLLAAGVQAPQVAPPELAWLVVIDPDTGDQSHLEGPEAWGYVHLSWSADSSAVYRAVAALTVGGGLQRSNAVSGATETLIPGVEGALRNLIAFLQPMDDGSLLLFMNSSVSPDEMSLPALTMMRAAADGVSGRTALRQDAYPVVNALWSAEGSGAVIVNGAGCDEYCPLLWLPAGDGAALPLPVQARYIRALRWGAT